MSENSSFEQMFAEDPRLKVFNDTVPAGMMVIRVDDGKIVFTNRYLVETLGIDNEQALGESWVNFFADPGERQDLMIEFSEKGEVRYREIRLKKKGGTTVSCLVSLSEVLIEDDYLLLFGFTDITPLKEVEEKLQCAHDLLEIQVAERTCELEETNKALLENEKLLKTKAVELRTACDTAAIADRAKSEFLTTMSHELRTPLNAVIGFSEILAKESYGAIGNKKYLEYSSDIFDSGRHLLDLINDILDLSRVESGKDELHDDVIMVEDTCNALLKLVSDIAKKSDVELEFKHSGNLDGLRVDERKFKQILINLLSNAIKFTDAGGNVTLSVWSRVDSGYVFQVIDTGIGIAPDDIPKALSRFGKIDGDLSRKVKGTGLGLPLSKVLVEQHGGTLDVQSKIKVGTTVTARFPSGRIVT